MSRALRRMILCTALVSWTAAAARTSAVSFAADELDRTVRIVADTREAFTSLTAAPRASVEGHVVFHGVDRSGSEGVFLSQGGVPMPVVQAGQWLADGPSMHRVEGLGFGPAVSSTGVIVLSARFTRGSAVLLRDGALGEWRFVADSAEAFREFAGTVWINAAGEVLFRASVDPPGHPDRDDHDPDLLEREGLVDDPDLLPPERRATPDGMARVHHLGLFLETGAEVLAVAGTHADFADLDDRFAVDDRGRVAYRCQDANRRVRMVSDDGRGRPFTIADSQLFYDDFGPPAVNARGDVVFAARLKNADRWVLCLGRAGRSQPQVLLDDSERSVAPAVAVSAAGEIVLVLRSGTARGRGEDLILRDARGQVEFLARSGQILAGRRVVGFELSAQPFAGRLGIAVKVDLENEERERSEVIAMVRQR